MAIITVAGAAAIIAALCLLLHYEVLHLLFRRSHELKHVPRFRVVVVFGALMSAHLVEIWIFAFGYWLLCTRPELGRIEGPVHHILDYVYFSSVTYSTIGFGDIVPVGPVRFIAATEAISGLFMITWSASFLFGQMHDFWSEKARL